MEEHGGLLSIGVSQNWTRLKRLSSSSDSLSLVMAQKRQGAKCIGHPETVSKSENL